MFIDKFEDYFTVLGTTEVAYFWPPNTIPMVLLSLGLFGVFLHWDIPHNRAINLMASTTLGIYLFHDGNLRGWLWQIVFNCTEHQDSPFLFFYILGAALIIVLVGAGIDVFRQQLERPLAKALDYGYHGGFWRDWRDIHMKKNRGFYLFDYFRKFLSAQILIFCLAFVVYVFLGLCLSYQAGLKSGSMFFGAYIFGTDNMRVFLDLTSIEYNHNKARVHPLFPLLTETVTLLVDGAVNLPKMSVILVESFCGALTLSLFWSTLKRKGVSPLLRGVFTFLFGASFSMMIFSTIPETFIFAGLGLMGFWYLVTLLSSSKGPFSKYEEFLLICGGIVCFGVTLTNYVSYLIGLTYLLLCRLDIRGAVKKFLGINVRNAVIIAVLCKFQQFVWRQCPLFWTCIVQGIQGAGYEEISYMNWSVSWEKTVSWFKQCVLYPLLSPDVYLASPSDAYSLILFWKYPLWAKFTLVVFLLIVGGCVLAYLYKMTKKFHFVEYGYMLGLILAWIGNMVLHYIFCYEEAFLYSPHHLFLFLLVAAIALERMEIRKVKTGIIAGVLLFCAVMMCNNLWRYFQTMQLALSMCTVESSFTLVKAVKGTIMCGGLLSLGVVWWLCVNQKKNLSALPNENPNTTVQQFVRVIKVYMTIVFVVGIMVAYNW